MTESDERQSLVIPDGWLRDKDKLRANFEIGLKTTGLKFELVGFARRRRNVLVYRWETVVLVTDLIELDSSRLGRRVVACYGQAGMHKVGRASHLAHLSGRINCSPDRPHADATSERMRSQALRGFSPMRLMAYGLQSRPNGR